MAGHVDVRVTVRAPLDAVWRMATDPGTWAKAGHAVRDLKVDGDVACFRVVTPPDAQGRSWSYSVERFTDPQSYTVYSRRVESDDFRYGHTLYAYRDVPNGTEMRCVVDFETTPSAGVSDDEMATAMESGMRRNMTETARLIERQIEEEEAHVGSARHLVDRVWDAVESGNLDQLDQLFWPDAEMRTSAGGDRGTAYIKEMFARHRSGYHDIRHRVNDVVESPGGDAIALEIEFTATHGGTLRGPFGEIAATGRQLRWRSSDHVRIRDGRITSWHAHFDRLALLLQLGQAEALSARS